MGCSSDKTSALIRRWRDTEISVCAYTYRNEAIQGHIEKVVLCKTEECPHQKPTLLASCFYTSSLQNWEKVNIYSFKLSNLWCFVMAVHTDKYIPFLFLFRILPVAQNDGSVFFTVPFSMINSSYVAFLTSYVTFNLLGTLCFRPPSFGLIFQARSLWNSKRKLFAFKLVL